MHKYNATPAPSCSPYHAYTTTSHSSILVIDDTPENLRLIASIFEESNYDVRLAPDGTMGLLSAQASPPDIILLDIAMPDIDGYEVCRRLKSNAITCDVPVIFISAFDRTLNVVEAFHVGGIDYISRPFQTEEVRVRVNNHLLIQQTHNMLQQRLVMEELISTVSTRFINVAMDDVNDAINTTLCDISTFLVTDYCLVALFDEHITHIAWSQEWDSTHNLHHINHEHPLPLSQFSWSIDCLQRGEIINITQLDDLPPQATTERTFLYNKGIHSLLVIPLQHKHRLLGVMGLTRSLAPSHWSEADILLLRTIGNVIMNAILRKQTELYLREERECSQRYLDMAGVLFISLDITGHVVLANQQACQLLGYTMDELIGMNWIQQCIPTQDQLKVTHIFEQLIQGELPSFEHTDNVIITKHGEKRFITWHNTLIFNKDGTIQAILGAGMDITERRNVESELAATHMGFQWVVEHAENGFLLLDKYDHIHYANHMARHALELPPSDTGDYTEEKQLLFLQQAKMVYNLHPTNLWEDWHEILAEGELDHITNTQQHPPRYLVRPETPSSHALWLHVDLLQFPEGIHTRRLVSLKDVTTQMISQRQMWTFHALISHKMNTPLSCLMNSLYLLSNAVEQNVSASMKEYATIAMESGNQLNQYIRNIRHFLVAPGLALPGQECPISHIPSIIKQVQQEITIKELHITMPQYHTYHAVVLSQEAIRLLIRQVLENTYKFHPTKTPTVDVYMSIDETTHMLQVTISDDGITVPQQQLAQVWKPYYQIDKGFSGQIPGMGLGLSIVAALLWNVGGMYEITNRKPSPGIVVDLRIPLCTNQI